MDGWMLAVTVVLISVDIHSSMYRWMDGWDVCSGAHCTCFSHDIFFDWRNKWPWLVCMDEAADSTCGALICCYSHNIFFWLKKYHGWDANKYKNMCHFSSRHMMNFTSFSETTHTLDDPNTASHEEWWWKVLDPTVPQDTNALGAPRKPLSELKQTFQDLFFKLHHGHRRKRDSWRILFGCPFWTNSCALLTICSLTEPKLHCCFLSPALCLLLFSHAIHCPNLQPSKEHKLLSHASKHDRSLVSCMGVCVPWYLS